MKRFGARRVAKEAVEEVAEYVESVLMEIVKDALIFAKHAGRKTIFARDIRMARRKLIEKFKI